MRKSGPFQDIPLPDYWQEYVKWAVIQTISLAHWAITYTRSLAINSSIQRVRLAAQLEQARAEIAMLCEEIRIKDARMAKVEARRRPHYPASERMAILELKAGRAWNLVETAKTFLLEPDTVSSWIDRTSTPDDRLLQISEPANKYPDYVRYIIVKLKALCPTMGKRKIADTLAMAGIHLAATTVWRVLQEPELPPKPDFINIPKESTGHVVTAKYPNHLWNVDLTTVPTSGFWAPWFPFCLAQIWPFSWWVLVIVDHFSRAVVGFAVFRVPPTSQQVLEVIAAAIEKVGQAPKYLISDQGKQFKAEEFQTWCDSLKPRKIVQRFGAVGQHGSIALIERFIRSMKQECTKRISVPIGRDDMREELNLFADWYNQWRPHQGLDSRVPMDVFLGIDREVPWFETRGHNAVPLRLIVSYHGGRKHLPIVELEEAA